MSAALLFSFSRRWRWLALRLIMIFNGLALSALLQMLSLKEGSFKPNPGALSPAVAGNNTSDTRTFFSSPSSPAGTTLLDTTGDLSASNSNACFVEPYTPPPLNNQTLFPPFDPAMAKIFRYRQQQSVNLGSWFVHEDWMSPSLFKCAAGKKLSELDIASGWGSLDSARSLLERHWDTWITESDFKYLASIGINTVRLPIGYWSLGPHYCQDTPFAPVAEVYRNSWPRIVRAINAAADEGIGVLVDLHGAVGSQNGQPHSGISDGATNMFNNPSNTNKTIDVLLFLMQQLSPVTNVVGIQLLNEPKNLPELTDFYTRAIESMRQIPTAAAPSFPLYLHNGFDLDRFSNYVGNRTDFVVQDHHSYFVFTPSDETEPASQHTHDVQGPISDTLSKASKQQHRNLVVDEWSCALTSESLAHESDKSWARSAFCEGQMNVYTNTTAGWSFWAYLKEGCDDDPGWCFKAAVNKSLPATFFSYAQAPTDPRQLQTVSNSIENIVIPPAPDILAKFPEINAPSHHSRQWYARNSIFWSGVSSHHRFEAIHNRQSTSDGLDMTAEQRSTTKGYSDGFYAAKIFALFGLSKLGFTGQYILDSIAQLGPTVVTPETEQNYHQSFIQGLADGQAGVMTRLNPSP